MTEFWDPDISALDLTPEEKNGLQVFRSYSSAFERQRAADFVSELDSSVFDLSPLERVLAHIVQEDAKMLPVIACAFVDDAMLSMLRREIPEGVPSGKGSLLSGFGPLARLSSRVQICYAFGWLDQELLKEIDSLRKIRNDISHKWDIHALQDRINQFVASTNHPIEAAFDQTGRAPKEFYKDLELIDRLRLRLIWVLGRLFYECLVWVPAVKANLPPHQTLYTQNTPKALIQMADICMKASRQLVAAS